MTIYRLNKIVFTSEEDVRLKTSKKQLGRSPLVI